MTVIEKPKPIASGPKIWPLGLKACRTLGELGLIACILLLISCSKPPDAASDPCVTNLRILGKAALQYVDDNEQKTPTNFMVMSNYLFPRNLVCPEQAKPYKMARTTFESTQYMRVFAGCPYHGYFLLLDGSVQHISIYGERDFHRKSAAAQLG